jgi:hypothetical protein
MSGGRHGLLRVYQCHMQGFLWEAGEGCGSLRSRDANSKTVNRSWEASIRPWQGRGHRMPPPPGLWEPPSHFLTTSLPDTVDVGSAE